MNDLASDIVHQFERDEGKSASEKPTH
jgi:hypothetical protein